MAAALANVLSGSTPKRFWRGTHRACAPGETVARLRPLCSRCGITRVANVTGLDRLGVPVVMVVRPNARSLSVSQGKGLDIDAARASGIMESLELHFAERPRLEVRVAPFAVLRAEAPVVEPGSLLLRPGVHDASERAVAWVRGRDLLAGRDTWVPYERVGVDFNTPGTQGLGVFARDSNGLASGNSLVEAVAQALLEVVERDALALEKHRRGLGTWSPLVEPSGCDSVIDGLVERCQANAITVCVRDVISDIGVPTYEATLVEVGEGPLPRTGPMTGIGCHPDPKVALSRAVTEAAQSRLTQIAGSRDDITSNYYGVAYRNSSMPEPGPDDSIRELPPHRAVPQPTFEADVEVLLDRLHACGIRQVIAVDLSPAGGSIAVVRVVIPGLEASPEHPEYAPGARAMAISA